MTGWGPRRQKGNRPKAATAFEAESSAMPGDCGFGHVHTRKAHPLEFAASEIRAHKGRVRADQEDGAAMRSNANCGNQVLTLQARHLAIVYQNGVLLPNRRSASYTSSASKWPLRRHSPSNRRKKRRRRAISSGCAAAYSSLRIAASHINKVRPLISNFLRLNLAENIAHKCARRTEELEL